MPEIFYEIFLNCYVDLSNCPNPPLQTLQYSENLSTFADFATTSIRSADSSDVKAKEVRARKKAEHENHEGKLLQVLCFTV